MSESERDRDENGDLNRREVGAPEDADERRVGAGLESRNETAEPGRAESDKDGQQSPKRLSKQRAKIEAWARQIGWLDDAPE